MCAKYPVPCFETPVVSPLPMSLPLTKPDPWQFLAAAPRVRCQSRKYDRKGHGTEQKVNRKVHG